MSTVTQFAPLVYLNHDLCPECGNVALPRPSRCCDPSSVAICVECGAAVERGAIEGPLPGELPVSIEVDR